MIHQTTQIRHIKQLSDPLAGEVRALAEACGSHHACPAFPWEDYTDAFLLLENVSGRLLSVLAVIRGGEDEADDAEAPAAWAVGASAAEAGVDSASVPAAEAECIGFTAPEFRRRGFFEKLVNAAADYLGDTDMLFPLRSDDDESRAALEALGAEPLSEEYRMEREFSADEVSAGELSSPEQKHSSPELSCCHLSMVAEEDGTGGICFTFYLHDEEEEGETAVPAGTPAAGTETAAAPENTATGKIEPASAPVQAGICRILREADAACFYGFEIAPSLRGKGLGNEALSMVLTFLASQGIRKIFLHVSADNTPALKLYQKAGFRVTERLEYWIY